MNAAPSTFTVAPGTLAPDASETVPEIVPLVSWPNAATTTKVAPRSALSMSLAKLRRDRIFFITFSYFWVNGSQKFSEPTDSITSADCIHFLRAKFRRQQFEN